jgi:hypothetical protein
MFSKIAIALFPFILAATTEVAAICPGFNFAIGNVIPEGKLGDSELNRCMYLSAREF